MSNHYNYSKIIRVWTKLQVKLLSWEVNRRCKNILSSLFKKPRKFTKFPHNSRKSWTVSSKILKISSMIKLVGILANDKKTKISILIALSFCTNVLYSAQFRYLKNKKILCSRLYLKRLWMYLECVSFKAHFVVFVSKTPSSGEMFSKSFENSCTFVLLFISLMQRVQEEVAET